MVLKNVNEGHGFHFIPFSPCCKQSLFWSKKFSGLLCVVIDIIYVPKSTKIHSKKTTIHAVQYL